MASFSFADGRLSLEDLAFCDLGNLGFAPVQKVGMFVCITYASCNWS